MTLVSAQTHLTKGPTVILIGGPMTLESGEQLDSRQSIDGDPRSKTISRILGESMSWWMATSPLVDAILDSDGPDAFALVIGRSTVIELKPDRSLRRVRLASLLRGGLGTVRVASRLPVDLPENYLRVAEDAETGFVVAIEPIGDTNRWRVLKGSTASFPDACAAIGARVVVDTTSRVTRMSYDRYTAQPDDLILVLPHTDGNESYLRGVQEWIRRGRPPTEPFEHWTGRDNQLPPGTSAEPVAVSTADYRVTGLCRGGEWRDPAGLEAARVFVASRFDLRIGIWDLADNPSLRDALLQPEAATPAPSELAPSPKGDAKRSVLSEGRLQRAAAASEARRKREHEAFDVIAAHCSVLPSVGWESTDRGPRVPGTHPSFRLPLLRSSRPLPGGGQMRADADLSLVIGQHHVYVYLSGPYVGELFDLGAYLEPKRDVLTEIASPDPCILGPRGRPVLWRPSGGWDDVVDWPERIAQLRAKTPLWLEAFGDLPQNSDAWVQRFGEGKSGGE